MQRYYLKILNKIFLYFFAFFIILLSYSFLYLNLKKIDQKNNFFDIPKGSNLTQIVNSILINENYFNKKIYFYFLIIYDNFLEKIKYGEFVFDDNANLIQITKTFSKPSNYYRDFKVIGGWNKYQLDELIKEKFNTAYSIPYNEIIADTYSYQSHNKIEDVFKLMKKNKNNFFSQNSDNSLFSNYNIDQIMIISSLVEKEGKTDFDKQLIASVIFNRLERQQKLQIDATTIFSITKGIFKFDRKLTKKDLKIIDEYNTYHIHGLPPHPICYVSRKTIEIVLKNYNSDFLFYFFDEKNNKHIFSKNYENHKRLLVKYRNNE